MFMALAGTLWILWDGPSGLRYLLRREPGRGTTPAVTTCCPCVCVVYAVCVGCGCACGVCVLVCALPCGCVLISVSQHPDSHACGRVSHNSCFCHQDVVSHPPFSLFYPFCLEAKLPPRPHPPGPCPGPGSHLQECRQLSQAWYQPCGPSCRQLWAAVVRCVCWCLFLVYSARIDMIVGPPPPSTPRHKKYPSKGPSAPPRESPRFSPRSGLRRLPPVCGVDSPSPRPHDAAPCAPRDMGPAGWGLLPGSLRVCSLGSGCEISLPHSGDAAHVRCHMDPCLATHLPAWGATVAGPLPCTPPGVLT